MARPADDPTIEGTELLLRRLHDAGTTEQAAFLIARELPGLIGADWATFSPAGMQLGGGAADRAHQRLVTAALSAGCVYSQGDPPTVAAVPVWSGRGAAGVILIGRDAGLCMPQLRTAALFADHAGALMPTALLAQTA